MDDTKYTPPSDWQEDMAKIQKRDKAVTTGIREVYKEISKPPKKVTFKPVPVKAVEVLVEEDYNLFQDSANSQIEAHEVLKDFFEIEDEVGYSEGEKLRDIWAYLSDKFPRAQFRERVHQLRKVENKLGQPAVGQSRLGKIHTYIYAQKVFEDAQRWRDGVLGKRVR